MRVVISKYFLLAFFVAQCYSSSEWEDEDNDEFKLMRYIDSLDETIRFAYKFRNNIYVNLGLGLFLAKVNIKATVENSEGLPESVLSSLLRLGYQLDKAMKYYNKYQVPQIIRRDPIQENISSLLNETTWLKRMRNYENKVLLKALGDSPVPDTVSWDEYIKRIDEGPTVPDRYQSINCMASVGENPIYIGRMGRCRIREHCYDVISDGTSDGYALTHRLLIILVGHFGRNCYIFSKSRDEALIQEMCAWALKEAHYIAEQGYLLRDLMMEQISLCTLNGYSEFLQHEWFSKFLEVQSSTGCFAEDLNGDCKEHPTAAAASSLAAAVRFWCQELY